jgi:hypothetical protein
MSRTVVQLARWEVLDNVVEAGTPPTRSTPFEHSSTRRSRLIGLLGADDGTPRRATGSGAGRRQTT